MLGASSISVVLDAYPVERAGLCELLAGLDDARWARPTECPAYDVKGVATHVLGDDLSLLSRQRDGAPSGLWAVAEDMSGADFVTILDAFNDRWVAAAGFLSPALLVELLTLTGEWTEAYYRSVDPSAPGEFVGLFGGAGPTSPFWQAIAREFVERWVHHAQIRRALGLGPLAARAVLEPGIAVVAAIAGAEATIPQGDGDWAVGDVVLGDAEQTATILTRGLPAGEVRGLATGPPDAVERFAALAGRP